MFYELLLHHLPYFSIITTDRWSLSFLVNKVEIMPVYHVLHRYCRFSWESQSLTLSMKIFVLLFHWLGEISGMLLRKHTHLWVNIQEVKQRIVIIIFIVNQWFLSTPWKINIQIRSRDRLVTNTRDVATLHIWKENICGTCKPYMLHYFLIYFI